MDDGRENGTAKAAKVNLTIAPREPTRHPSRRRCTPVVLEVGATASYDALMGWTDSERDDLYLKSADSEKGDRIVYRNNGVIQFTEGAGELGIHEVTLKVSDGKNSTHGTLRVDVRPKGSLAADRQRRPVQHHGGRHAHHCPDRQRPQHERARNWRLAKIDDQVANVRTNPDFAGNTFSFEPGRPAPTTCSTWSSEGPEGGRRHRPGRCARQDGDDLDPLATRDVDCWCPAQQALVDVLANDTDPSGGILVVQSVTVPERRQGECRGAGAPRAADQRSGGLDEPVTIGVPGVQRSPGATGEVRVIPVGRRTTRPAPVDARQPSRGPGRRHRHRRRDSPTTTTRPATRSSCCPSWKRSRTRGNGVAFVSEGKVRFRANDGTQRRAGRDRLRGPRLQGPRDRRLPGAFRCCRPTRNATRSRSPTSVTARAIAGTSVRIPIPLDAIDPDGDSVELVGIAYGAEEGPGEVRGRRLAHLRGVRRSAGTDSFSYQVRDRLGATGDRHCRRGDRPPVETRTRRRTRSATRSSSARAGAYRCRC